MSSVMIESKDGGQFEAYIAMPETLPAPAIIMIQEIFGVNQEMREKCDELASEGYIAICPDLFWRIEPGIQLVDSIEEQLQRAFELFGLFDVEKGMNDLQATLDFARSYDGCNGTVGCIGYCLGGKLAYMMAAQTNIDASIGYYGVAIDQMLDQAEQIKKPLMLHIAGADEFVPPEAQEKIVSALKDNPFVTIHAYPGMQHAFARGQGMHYDAENAEQANSHTRAFLNSNLRKAQAA